MRFPCQWIQPLCLFFNHCYAWLSIIIITICHHLCAGYSQSPEPNHVFWAHNFAAFLYLQCMAHVMLFLMINASYFTLALPAVCVLCPVQLFSAVPWYRAFPVRCSSIFWRILKWFQLPLLLLASPSFFTYHHHHHQTENLLLCRFPGHSRSSFWWN
jgi:hypothetical protein